jgi:DNA-binding MarR family transcriptional regulator
MTDPPGVSGEYSRPAPVAEQPGGLESGDAWAASAALAESLAAQQMLQALRQITRAIDLDSRALWHRFGLTAPQLGSLLAISREQPISTGSLAKRLHLGQPTVTGIVDRLERRGYVVRERGERDRRSVLLRLTASGQQVLVRAPSLLHGFCRELALLEASERDQILGSLQRVAEMMERSARSCLQPVEEVLGAPRD